jgi:hypothetical protein
MAEGMKDYPANTHTLVPIKINLNEQWLVKIDKSAYLQLVNIMGITEKSCMMQIVGSSIIYVKLTDIEFVEKM